MLPHFQKTLELTGIPKWHFWEVIFEARNYKYQISTLNYINFKFWIWNNSAVSSGDFQNLFSIHPSFVRALELTVLKILSGTEVVQFVRNIILIYHSFNTSNRRKH